MKLAEKIYQCRKKAGLSQEALAAQLGVSRQAVSKWELGTAEPEPAKLKLLAEAFHVSVDWLLSEDDPAYTAPTPPESSAPSDPAQNLPGMLGRLFRRYGWLAGLYVIFVGAGGIAVGAVARFLVQKMFLGDLLGPSTSIPVYDETWSQAASHVLSRNPVYNLGGILCIVGTVILVAGIVLTILLYRRSRRK